MQIWLTFRSYDFEIIQGEERYLSQLFGIMQLLYWIIWSGGPANTTQMQENMWEKGMIHKVRHSINFCIFYKTAINLLI